MASPSFPTYRSAVLAFLARTPEGATTNMLLMAIDEALPDVEEADADEAVGTISDMVVGGELVVRDGRIFVPTKTTAPRIVRKGTADCLCGCGEQATRSFVPGHDAKLHSLVLRVHRGKAALWEIPTQETTRAYLRLAPWMTPEIARSIGLGEAP